MSMIALQVWPLVTLVLILCLPFHKAVLASILGGFLLLPPDIAINLPLLPILNKDTIPSLTLLVLAALLYRPQHQDRPGWVPRSVFAIAGLLMIFIGSQMTALTNGERVVYGPLVLPSLRPYDGMSMALQGLTIFAPLLLGRKFFAHPERQALLLRSLVVAALAYSLLALYEIRMSPQLNNIVYGYYSSSFAQTMRGGWRPAVFMDHGLQLALFFAAVTLAAFGASRYLETRRRRFYLIAGAWLLGTLVLSNSLGALIIAVVFLPVVLFTGLRIQLLFAAAMAGTVMLYPMLRSADVIPTDRLISMAASIDTGRAASLRARIDNEDILLEHAGEKPLFGWGGWRRNRVFNEAGQDITVTDGAWIIMMGVRGWVGYIAQFGLLTLPVVLLAFNRRRYEVSSVTVVLVLVLTAMVVDLIPNGFLSPVTLLLAGALWGRLELGASVAAKTEPTGDLGRAREGRAMKERAEGRGAPAYTRQEARHQRIRKSC